MCIFSCKFKINCESICLVVIFAHVRCAEVDSDVESEFEAVLIQYAESRFESLAESYLIGTGSESISPAQVLHRGFQQPVIPILKHSTSMGRS
jgi:hypothetical protein